MICLYHNCVGTKLLGNAIVLCHHSVSFTIDGSDDLLRPYWIELTRVSISHQLAAIKKIL